MAAGPRLASEQVGGVGCGRQLRVLPARYMFSSRFGMMAAVALAAAVAKGGENPTAQARADSQLWSELDVILPLTDHVELTWVSLARFSSDVGGAVTYANGLYGDIGIGRYLTLTPFYNDYSTYSYARRSWGRSEEPGLDLTVAVGSPHCLLSDRSRFYYVLGESNTGRIYRNRPRIDCRVGAGPPELTLYVSNEFFHYSMLGGWPRSRLIGGARKVLNTRCAIDVYYLRQVDQHQGPRTINAFGITLELRVGKLE